VYVHETNSEDIYLDDDDSPIVYLIRTTSNDKSDFDFPTVKRNDETVVNSTDTISANPVINVCFISQQ
jgi:hypothetical protein